ncbi:unnamed protein product [marine sediment metagenome]|uniref:Uncharacterized protein n=1 Tax=marine sediment metagenome TaxID=412755 RepID=X1TTH7_9ZZZZ
MPKAKPDQVIVHRIELQETERELLSGLTAAFQFNRIAEPIVKLLNDVTGTITFLTLLAASGILAGITFNFIYDALSAKDPLEQFLTQLQEAKQLAEDVGGTYKRGALWGLIDLIEIATGSNLPDFGGGYEPPGTPGFWDSQVAGVSFNDPNVFLSEAWFSQFETNPNATGPLWNEGVPTGPVQADGSF